MINVSAPGPEVAVVGRDASVVLVDDDPVIATLVKRVLAKHGLTVAWFPDGVAAVAALCPPTAWLQVKLILLDVSMPGLGGFGVLHYLRRDGVRETGRRGLQLGLLHDSRARVTREPSGLTFYVQARNPGNAILQGVRGGILVTRGHRTVVRAAIGPGTFVSGTSIAYPLMAPREQPHEGAVYRVRAVMRYAHGKVARLDTQVRFGHVAAETQQDFGGPRAAEEDEPAVDEDDRSEDRRDEGRAGEHGGGLAEPVLRVAAPDEDRDRQCQAEPELVAEHRHRVTSVAVMGPVGSGGPISPIGDGPRVPGVRGVGVVIHRTCEYDQILP